jgi:hypothetical protein
MLLGHSFGKAMQYNYTFKVVLIFDSWENRNKLHYDESGNMANKCG